MFDAQIVDQRQRVGGHPSTLDYLSGRAGVDRLEHTLQVMRKVTKDSSSDERPVKVQISQPFREERCAPRQSNLGKVISLVHSLLIRAHGNPQLSLSIFQT